MREYWKKTSLLYKLIAVLLTVVMVGTSLYFHFDRKFSAKASTDGTYTWGKLYLPNGNDATVFGQGGWLIGDDNKQFSDTCKVRFYVSVDSESILDSVYIKHNVGLVDGIPDNLKNYYTKVTNNYGTSKIYYVSPDTYEYGTENIKDEFFIDEACGDEDRVFDITVTSSDFATPQLAVTATIDGTNLNGESFDTLGQTSKLKINVASPQQISTFTIFGESPALGNAEYNTQTELYEYPEYVYSFGEKYGETTKAFDNKTVVVGYDDSNKVTFTATSLIYDGTAPVISATVGGSALDEAKWNDSNSVVFTITSGTGANETAIETVSFAVNENPCSANKSGDNYTVSNLQNGTNTIIVEAVDEAGNSTMNEYSVKVDYNTPPTITSIGIPAAQCNSVSGTTYVKLDSDNKVIIGGNVTDNASGTKTLHVEGTYTDLNSDDHAIDDNHTASPAANSSGEYPTNYDYSFSLASVLGTGINLSNHGLDGTYSIYVVPTDAAGNEGAQSSTLNFVLDTVDPEVTDTGIQRHEIASTITDETAEGYWEDVPAEEIKNGKYLVNKAKYSRIRYKAKATDINFNTLKFVSGGSIKNYFDSSSADSWCYCEVSVGDITKASALSYSVTVNDKALNEKTVALPELQEVNSDLTVNLVSLAYNGQPIVSDVDGVTDLSTYFSSNYNGIYTLTLNVASGYEVGSVVLNKDGHEYKKFSGEDSTIINTPDSSGVYVTNNLTFVLPKPKNPDEEKQQNELLNSMSITVTDTYTTPRSVTIPLGDLLYDNTKPIVVNTGSLDPVNWYQDYTLSYEIKSGSNVDTVPESNLKTASYNIDGGSATPVDVAGVKKKTGTIDIPESTTIAGTKVVFDATDNATNTIDTASGTYPNQIFIRVDKTAPAVAPLSINGESVNDSVVLAGSPSLTSTITDNLTISNYNVSVLYNGAAYADYPVFLNKDDTSEFVDLSLQQLIGANALNDGRYDINVIAWDKSGRASNVSTTAFIVDNTIPVVTADIVGGTSGKSNGFYNTDVTVRLTCKDNNFDQAAMVVTDNGSAVSADWKLGTDLYYADVVLSSEGLHNIIVSGKDKAGNAAVPKQATFTIDKTTPAVTLLVNGGQVYNESRGTLNLTGPLALNVSVMDTNEDAGDLRIQVIKTVPDTATNTSAFMPTGERTFSFADEADYTVNIFAVDKANNQGPTRTISFRVDATAPQLTITGANGGTSSAATTVSFNINESFWSDAKGTVEIYRKAGDGVDEVLFKTLTLTPTQKNYSLSETLTESGIYRFEFTANDKVGHTATTSQKVTVDRNKPEITLTGVKNYDATDGEVSISAVIKDEFYANKKVSISGTRIDASGKKVPLSFSPFAATANPTTISDTFKEDGIYDITITSTDIAGNVASSSVHFTIDTSEPVIGDLSQFDGKTFKSIELDSLDLDSLVSDLTVCEVRMYLNGSEYDGLSEIEDGSYTLLITAEDELGHKTEKTATFVLDTKVPVFIVTGVEDGEVKDENYSIEVSLQLDEDTLEKVTLNGKDVSIKDNEASFNVTEKGKYELYMKAVDEAGNEAEQTITFTFGDESVANAVSDAVEKAASHWWLWAIVIAAIFLAGGFIFFIIKRRERD